MELSSIEIMDLLPIGACIISSDLTVCAWNQTLVNWTGLSKEAAIGINLGQQYPNLLSDRYHSRLCQVFVDGSTALYSAAFHKHFIPVPSNRSDPDALMIQQTRVRLLSRQPARALVAIQDVTAEYEQLAALRRERSQLISTQQKLEKTNITLAAKFAELEKAKTLQDENAQRLVQLVHELEHANARVVEAARSKSEFLANMSHEIRTPMTAILGFADYLLDSSLSEQEVTEAIHTIHRNGEHLLAIINDILDISKFEAGRMTVEQITCSPIEIIEDVASLMRGRAEEKNLYLDVEYHGHVPTTIQSDPTRLRQILMNLIGNAIKFTEVGGVKTIVQLDDQTDPHNPKLRIDITDTGIGLSKQQQSILFRPFTQADSSMTRQFGGTGLGLTISKRLTEMLGGEITLHSVPEKGSTFTVTIQTGKLTGVQMTEASHGSPHTPQQKFDEQKFDAITDAIDGRILLAEDSPDNQRLISFILKKAGAAVEIAQNGQEALDEIRASHSNGNGFDLILLDMQMPVLDGYATAKRLRSDGHEEPIIALTAHAMDGDRQKCLDAGCDDFATKPIDRKLLVKLVAKYLKQRQQSLT